MRRIVKAALAGAAAYVGIAGAQAPAQASDIKVGLLLPYSGVYASLGQEIDDGFALALETYGGQVDATFEIVREDTEAAPAISLAKTLKLILQDRVDIIAGVVSSAVLGAIRDMIHGAEVPLIVANAGNDQATGEDCSRYIVRVSFSNSQVSRPMGQWIYDRGVRKVYTLAPDYTAGRQIIGAFIQAFIEAGGKIVEEEYTPFGKTRDFGPYLMRARASGADAVYAFYAGDEAIAFVKQYDSFGLKQALPLYGAGFLTSPLYVEAEGEAANGVIGALHYVPTIDTPENIAFVRDFREKTGRTPSEYAVQGYDAGRVLIEAVKTGATDRKSLAAALPAVRFTGPRGPLSIDPATNNVVQTVYVYETVVGKDSPTQKILSSIPDIRDPLGGCGL